MRKEGFSDFKNFHVFKMLSIITKLDILSKKTGNYNKFLEEKFKKLHIPFVNSIILACASLT